MKVLACKREFHMLSHSGLKLIIARVTVGRQSNSTTLVYITNCVLNNCINAAVAKKFHVSFGNNVDFICQMTGLTSLRILVSERRSRFY